MKLTDIVAPDKIGSLTDELKGILFDSLNGLIEGAEQDLQNFVTAIVNDFTMVGLIQDQATRAAVSNELEGQLKMVGELNRIRAVNASWAAVAKAVSLTTRVIGAVLANIRPL